MKSAEYLDQVKQKLGIHTDKDLAEHFGITKAAISQYKSGARIMENEMCLAVALDLDIDPMRVIMAADMDRANRSGQHSLWAVFSERMAATVASAVLVAGVTLFLTPQNAEARTYSPASSQNSNSLYIMSNGKRRRRLSLRAIPAWFERVFGPATLPTAAS
jgi:transcriptional regulator with XRE-family HTH domain